MPEILNAKQDGSYGAVVWNRSDGPVQLKVWTAGQLLAAHFPERKFLLSPWLREHETALVYAPTGVGKSFFSLSAAIAVAGGGSFLGWTVEECPRPDGWRVGYVDGEMNLQDVQERIQSLLDGAGSSVSREKVCKGLMYLARQGQKPGEEFPPITSKEGAAFYLDFVEEQKLDLLVLDNFSTLGEVVDENSADSFNGLQDFLLKLKAARVTVLFVHHARKDGEDFRGSSKLAVTFETIVKLEGQARGAAEAAQLAGMGDSGANFTVKWIKARNAGPGRRLRPLRAWLESPAEESSQRPSESLRWAFRELALDRLLEVKAGLEEGLWGSPKEIAEHFAVKPPAVTKWKKKGIAEGLWTEDAWNGGLMRGRPGDDF